MRKREGQGTGGKEGGREGGRDGRQNINPKDTHRYRIARSTDRDARMERERRARLNTNRI